MDLPKFYLYYATAGGYPMPCTLGILEVRSEEDRSRIEPASRSRPMEDLTSTIYKDLRKMAASQMSGESHPQTLQATALVHEAWLRVGGDKQPDWANRAHFFGAAAEAMRRILVERARKRRALRHGGGMMRADADPDSEDFAEAIADPADDKALLLLHEALDELSAGDNQTADLVKLHYFAGLTIQEAAEVLGLSKRTAERRLTFARTWLVNQLKQE